VPSAVADINGAGACRKESCPSSVLVAANLSNTGSVAMVSRLKDRLHILLGDRTKPF
jgi:hypothetical protein